VTTEAFAIYNAAGAPLASQTPTWAADYNAGSGASISGPSFRELGGGLYAFDRPVDFDFVGLVDMGASANPRYGLAPARARESFALFRAEELIIPGGEGEPPTVLAAGSPLTGASPTWASLLRVSTGAAIAEQPTITELGGGVYIFARPPADEHWVGIIDGGAAANPRYHFFETGRELTPVIEPGNLGQGAGRVGYVLD